MRISPFFIHEFLDCPDMVVDIPSDTPYYTSESNNPKFSQSLFGCRSGDILGYYAFLISALDFDIFKRLLDFDFFRRMAR